MKKYYLFIPLFYFLTASTSVNAQDSWQGYIDGTVGRSTYYLYNQVLPLFKAHKKYHALDLGSGAGDPDVDLAAKGWDVTGVDTSARSGEVIQARTQDLSGHFQFQHADFANAKLEGNYDLMISFFSLPFGDKNTLPMLLANLSSHMKTGSVFAANFFGYDQTYVKNGQAYGMNKEELFSYLEKNHFQIKYFLNRVYEQKDFSGASVHWDILDVVAIKI